VSRPSEATGGHGVGRSLLLTLAVGSGLMSASVHWAQPVLPNIGRDFGSKSWETGLIMTCGQFGYALGLAFVVPLGDRLERRRLLVATVLAAAVGLAGAAAAPDLAVFYVVALVFGMAATAGQLMLAVTASMAEEDSRGRAVGLVMSGLLSGILLARTVSGLVAAAAGWRAVYACAAAASVILAVVLWRVVPSRAGVAKGSYRDLLASIGRLFASQPLLRLRALYGALGFAAFTGFWATLAFLLHGSPYHYQEWQIGLFGLLGLAGILVAPPAGRLADSGRERWATAAFAGSIAAAFAMFAIGRTHLIGLLLGVVLLDGGFQGLQVTNQAIVYRISTDSVSRITTAYMGTVFASGAAGSAAAALAYAAGGWYAVCAFGGALGSLAVLLGCAAGRSRVRPGRIGDSSLERPG
jgi:predicted MFS family arabinose efflux permease